MNSYINLVKFNDAGHGWLEVPKALIAAMLKNKPEITAWSYESHSAYYLEEDCDLQSFIDAWLAEYPDTAIRIQEVYDENCSIRRLPSVRA